VRWELEKVFYLEATGVIYPRSAVAEICSSWLGVTGGKGLGGPGSGSGERRYDPTAISILKT